MLPQRPAVDADRCPPSPWQLPAYIERERRKIEMAEKNEGTRSTWAAGNGRQTLDRFLDGEDLQERQAHHRRTQEGLDNTGYRYRPEDE